MRKRGLNRIFFLLIVFPVLLCFNGNSQDIDTASLKTISTTISRFIDLRAVHENNPAKPPDQYYFLLKINSNGSEYNSIEISDNLPGGRFKESLEKQFSFLLKKINENVRIYKSNSINKKAIIIPVILRSASVKIIDPALIISPSMFAFNAVALKDNIIFCNTIEIISGDVVN